MNNDKGNDMNNEGNDKESNETPNEKEKKMKNSIKRIKNHFKENKKVYLAVGATFLVTTAGTILLSQRKNGIYSDMNLTRVFSPGDNHVNVELTYLGHPGDAFQDLTDGTVYMSKGALARGLDVERRVIQKYLDNKIDDINGHTFKQLTSRGVPLAE